MRTWPQRLLIALNITIVVGTAAALGFGGFVYLRVRSIPTVDIGPTTPVPAPSAVIALPTTPQNFLIVGSDTRAGQDEDAFGTVEGQRADVILIARIDFVAGTASMLSVPRDLYVPIHDASGTELGEDRINTAFAGGPTQLVTTIRTELGVPIDHYLQVNFQGFRDVVDAIDGVEVYLAGPVRDRDDRGRNRAGLDIDASGCVRLDGTATLAYVRSRHFEQLVDGRWHRDPTGDLGRIRRQHDLARRIASQAIGRDLLQPGRLLDLVGAAEDNLVVDTGLSPASLVRFGQQLGAIDPDQIAQQTLAVTPDTTSAGASILRLDDSPANQALLDGYRGVVATTPSADGDAGPAPAAVTTTSTMAAPSC